MGLVSLQPRRRPRRDKSGFDLRFLVPTIGHLHFSQHPLHCLKQWSKAIWKYRNLEIKNQAIWKSLNLQICKLRKSGNHDTQEKPKSTPFHSSQLHCHKQCSGGTKPSGKYRNLIISCEIFGSCEIMNKNKNWAVIYENEQCCTIGLRTRCTKNVPLRFPNLFWRSNFTFLRCFRQTSQESGE